MQSKLPWIILGISGILSLGCFTYILRSNNVSKPISTSIITTSPSVTLSQEQTEIIKNIKTYPVSITETSFDPSPIKVKPFDQIEWKNNDSKNHQIVGENWTGSVLISGESFTKTFDKPGLYTYSCALHPEIKGQIEVQ